MARASTIASFRHLGSPDPFSNRLCMRPLSKQRLIDPPSNAGQVRPPNLSRRTRRSKRDSFRHANVVTPITTLDEPTTFVYDGDRVYEPNNFTKSIEAGDASYCASDSLNVPTIKFAERIGFDRVAALARRLGLNAKIKGYPSVALGDSKSLRSKWPALTRLSRTKDGECSRMRCCALLRRTDATNKAYKYEPQDVMRPELAYLMTNLMEGVIDSGTGVGVRATRFHLPAAGKTGTSRDGWFAGYTKDLLAIAWVGYDDNRDLNLEGRAFRAADLDGIHDEGREAVSST